MNKTNIDRQSLRPGSDVCAWNSDAWPNMYIPAMRHDAAGGRNWILVEKKRKKKTRSSATCGGNKVKVTAGRTSYSGEGRAGGLCVSRRAL